MTEPIAGQHPSLLIVPGAWHKPEHYRRLIDELPGFDVHVVTLTSTADDPAVLTDMHADADVIAQAVAAIDGPVVVIAHSYGGAPATQALAGANNVQRIIYLAAFLLDPGSSVLTPSGGSLMRWAKAHDGQGCGDFVEATSPLTIFYNDVDISTARQAAALLGYQSYASMQQPLTAAAWQTIPSTYVICEADNAIPVALQESMATRADAVVRLHASHSPFLSQPAAVARLILRSLDAVADSKTAQVQ